MAQDSRSEVLGPLGWETMTSSWYGSESGHTRADGKPYLPLDISVAHKTLPFGTKLRIVNPLNSRSIIAVVLDRGPYVKGRELDCSEGAAILLGFRKAGLAVLWVQRLNYVESTKSSKRIRKNEGEVQDRLGASKEIRRIPADLQSGEQVEAKGAAAKLGKTLSRKAERVYFKTQIQNDAEGIRCFTSESKSSVCYVWKTPNPRNNSTGRSRSQLLPNL